MQETGQPFLHCIRVVSDPDDDTAVIDPKDDETAFGVGEGADRPADSGKLREVAFVFGLPVLTRLDAPRDVAPFHGNSLLPGAGSGYRRTGRPSSMPFSCMSTHSSMKVWFHWSVRGCSIMSR